MNYGRLWFACAALVGSSVVLLTGTACGGGDGGGAATVPPPTPSYTLTAAALIPASVTAGNSSTSRITVTPVNGYAGKVSVTCSTAAGTAGPACTVSPSSLMVSGAAATSTLTVSTSGATPGGPYTISVTAIDANKLAPSNGPQTLTLSVTAAAVVSYTLTATAFKPATITAGNSSTSLITVTPVNGYAGNVSVTCSSTATGAAAPGCTVNPVSLTISGGGAATATLTVSTSTATPSGLYTVSIAAMDANKLAPSNGPQSLTLSVTAPPVPSYTFTAAALNPATVTAGNSSTSLITVTPVNGYAGKVSLTCSSAAAGTAGPTCTVSPSSLTISGSAVTATLTVYTSMATPGGPYAISVAAVDADKLPPSNGSPSLTLTVAAVIEHIVVIFQENRTPDNLFQDPVLMARGADIASSGKNSRGQTIPLTPIDLGTVGKNPQNYDLSHTHDAFVAMYDGGKLDGTNPNCSPISECPPVAHPNFQYKYVMPADVKPYFALAEQYTFGDRMFQTNEGPSFPAHQFILAGTSAPTTASTLFAAENPADQDTTGCIGALTNTVKMIDASGSEDAQPAQYPCFEHPTLTDLLETQGTTWRYYTPSAGSFWTAPVAIQHICQRQTISGVLTCAGPEFTGNVVIPQTGVLTDIANGKLAQVSWVIPDGKYSDHALVNDGTGPSWVASVVNAIGNSPYWANTAIIITWDDWGGWYDHVVPKVIDDGVSWGSGYAYGFRVPLIVVSPYARAAYISHVTHDFGSILKFVETTFNLPSLGYADKPADDLADCFDLTQKPNTFTSIPAAFDAAHFLNDKSPATDPDDD